MEFEALVKHAGTPIEIAGTIYIVPMLSFKDAVSLADNIDVVHERDYMVAKHLDQIRSGDLSGTSAAVKEITARQIADMKNDLPIGLAAIQRNYPSIDRAFLEENADADILTAMVIAAIVRNRPRSRKLNPEGESQPTTNLPSQLTGTLSRAELSQLPDGALKQ